MIPIIGDIIGGVIDKAGSIIGKAVVDKDKQAQLQADLERLKIEEVDKAAQRIQNQMIAQIDVNKVEAASSSMFVAGWRPAIGWVGAIGLGYSFVFEPFFSWAATVIWKYTGAFPALDTGTLMILITGMLGFGGLRTYEKTQGVADTKIKGQPTNILPANFDTPPEEAPWVEQQAMGNG